MMIINIIAFVLGIFSGLWMGAKHEILPGFVFWLGAASSFYSFFVSLTFFNKIIKRKKPRRIMDEGYYLLSIITLSVVLVAVFLIVGKLFMKNFFPDLI